ncbi:hypothetical protein Hanom_Chr09g00830121 [Helianthus anomalus]
MNLLIPHSNSKINTTTYVFTSSTKLTKSTSFNHFQSIKYIKKSIKHTSL